MSESVSELFWKLRPYIDGRIQTLTGITPAGVAGYAPTPHDLVSIYHSGQLPHGDLSNLTNDDHTQYLRTDGGRTLAGNLTVGSGVTIDGVDVSAHAADANAHHNRAHSVLGVSDHTVTGSQYQIVGLTGANTLGLLTPASTVGANQIPIGGASGAVTWQGVQTMQEQVIVGTDASPGDAYGRLNIWHTRTSPHAVQDSALWAVYYGNPSAHYSGTIEGADITAAVPAANTRNFTNAVGGLRGVGGAAVHGGGGIVSAAVGVSGWIWNVGAGSITNAFALQALNPFVSAGSVANAYGLHIQNMTAGASFNYGIYVEGAATAAIYVASGVSRFAGNVITDVGIQTFGNINMDGMLSIVSSGTNNLTIAPGGDLLLDPTGNDVLPVTNYDINLGALSKKYLTLHAAELWVETLVAQETIATIGGRVLVGPTTVLEADLGPADARIATKHNQMDVNDTVYLEANGKVEFMRIGSFPIVAVSAASNWLEVSGDYTSYFTAGQTFTVRGSTGNNGEWTVSLSSYDGGANRTRVTVTGDMTDGTADGYVAYFGSGPYRYAVIRNLDGTGANQWYAGDAVFNTGTAGNGFIDLYSVAGIVSGNGPTIVGRIRNSTTFNDIAEHWAIGNLDQLYGYAVTTYGAAFGKYATGQSWIGVDATNGIRIMNYTTPKVVIQTDGDLFIGTNISAPATTVLAVFTNAQTYNGEAVGAGDLLIGDNSSGKANVLWDKSAGQLLFRGGTTTQAYIGTDGQINAGGGTVRLNTSGIEISTGTQVGNALKWISGGTTYGSIGTDYSVSAYPVALMVATAGTELETGLVGAIALIAKGATAAGAAKTATLNIVAGQNDNYLSTDSKVYPGTGSATQTTRGIFDNGATFGTTFDGAISAYGKVYLGDGSSISSTDYLTKSSGRLYANIGVQVNGDVIAGTSLGTPAGMAAVFGAAADGGGIAVVGRSTSTTIAPGFSLADTTTVKGSLGLATAADRWVTGAVNGDIVLRADTGAIRLANGNTVTGLKLKSSYVHLKVQNAAPTDADIENGNAVAYLDQTNNQLLVRVRYSDGTLKTGTIALS